MPSPRPSVLLKAALLAALPSLLAGCANNFNSTAGSGPAIVLSNIQGRIHGGSQPILGATINLYAAGTTGYGSAGKLLATTTSSTTDSSFGFTQQATPTDGTTNAYACPNGNSLIYIIGSGGNTQNTLPDGSKSTTNNPAAVLMAALGNCTAAGTIFVNLNEITTVASVFALQQYMNPTAGVSGAVTVGTASDYTIGSPAQSGQGLINQFALVPKLVDFPSGSATASFTQSGTATTVAAVTVTATPEQAKINTIADILAACVNQTDGSTTTMVNGSTTQTACGTLFANAVPPASSNVTSQPSANFTNPVNTLQAAYYMAINPTDGSATNVQNLYNLASPTAPFQGTLSAQPTDWTLGIVYNSGTTTCSNGALFINYGYGISIDATGNVWMANGASATDALTEMSALGVPQACSALVSTSRGGGAIDTAGNVWITSSLVNAVYKYNPTTGTTTTIPTPGSATKAINYNIAADGVGNVFFDNQANTKIYELPSSATATTALVTACTVTGNVSGVAVDTKGTIFLANNATNAAFFCPLTNAGGTTYSGVAAQQSVTGTGAGSEAGNFNSPYGVAIDGTGGALYTNSSTTIGLTRVTPSYSGTTPQTVSESSAVIVPPGSGLSTARQLSVDGAGNAWIANSGTPYSMTVVGKDASVLSGSGGFQKSSAYFTGPRAVAVDFSGNVWITQTSSTANTIVTELVGAGVPVVTPISAQLSGNKIATKP